MTVKAITSVWAIIAIQGLTGCGRLGFDEDQDPNEPANARQYLEAVLADGPIGYWSFDETSGTVAVDAIGDHHGTYSPSGITFDAPGAIPGARPNGAVRLDGVSGRIDFGDVFTFANRAPFSFEVWAQPATVQPDVRFLFERRSTGQNDGYTCYFRGASSEASPYALFTRTGAGTIAYSGSEGLTTTRYQHLAGTFDGVTLRFYTDGVLTEETVSATDLTTMGPGNFVLGDAVGGNYYKFSGELDELAIYDHALSADAILAHVVAGAQQ